MGSSVVTGFVLQMKIVSAAELKSVERLNMVAEFLIHKLVVDK